MSIDHKIPKSQEATPGMLTWSLNNLQLMCRTCNSKKGTTMISNKVVYYYK